MIEVPFTLAFTAGLVATVNPCGFAMLPAYLSYFVGLDEGGAEAGRAGALASALGVGVVVSGGFLLVFAVAGVVVTFGLRVVVDALPWAAIVVGVGVVGLGVAMLAGYEPVFQLPKLQRGGGSRGVGSVFTFGVSYAVASLSCTLPVFLTVVAASLPRQGVLSGVATFLVYGAGMSLMLVAATVALAVGKRAMVGWLRRAGRYVNPLAGVMLIITGAYIVVFWWVDLVAGPGVAAPFSEHMDRLSSTVTEAIGGAPVAWGAAFATAIVAAVVVMRWRSVPRRDTASDHDEVTPRSGSRTR